MKIYQVFFAVLLSSFYVYPSQSLVPDLDAQVQKLANRQAEIEAVLSNNNLPDEEWVQWYVEQSVINHQMFKVLEAASTALSETLLDPNISDRAVLKLLAAESQRINDIMHEMREEKNRQIEEDQAYESDQVTN